MITTRSEENLSDQNFYLKNKLKIVEILENDDIIIFAQSQKDMLSEYSEDFFSITLKIQ